jgi:plastocyanin
MNCATAATLASGSTYSHTFTQAGSFPYFCRPHCSMGMTGTVVVQ